MRSLFKLSERINITKRRAVLFVLGGYTLTTVLLIVVALIKQPPNGHQFLLGAMSSVILFSGAWWLYFKHNWEPVRYFAVFAITLILGISLTGPYLMSYAPMEIIIPTVLALILIEPFGVIVNAILMLGILLIRANGSGVYADPVTLTIYSMIVGGLLVARLIMETSLRQLKKANEVIRQHEEQSMALVSSLDDMIFQFDERGTYLNIWAANESLLTQPKDQLLGKRIVDILGEEIGRRFEDAVRRVAISGQAEDIEYSLDVLGGKRWFKARINPVLEVAGSKRTVSMLIRDITERKDAEQAYAASQKYFQSLIEHAPDGIALLGINGKLQQVTRSTESILGYTLEDAKDQDPALLTHPDDLPALLVLLNDLLQNPGKVVRAEYRFKHKDGSWRYLESTISNMLHEPSLQAIVFNYRDITERKHADEMLANSERRFRALIENGLDYISLLSAEGKLLWESPANTPMLDYEWNAFIGKSIFELVHPDDLEKARGEFAEVLNETGSQRRSTFRIQHSSGAWHWVEAVATNLLHIPNIAAIVLNYHDITERKQSEEALRKSQETYRSLFENNPHPMWVYDLETLRFLVVNDAAVDHYGYSKDEFLNMTIKDIRPEEDLSALLNNLAQKNLVIQQSTGWRHIKKDGTLIDVEITSHSIQFEGREARLVLANDITERKRAEETLRERERQMQALVTSLDDIVFEFDEHGTYLNVWTGDDRLLAQPRFELLGRRSIDVLGKENGRPFIEAIERASKTGVSENIEYPLDVIGGRRWFVARISPILDTDGTHRTVSMLIRDITPRKQAEEELRSLNEKLEQRVSERTDQLNQTNVELERANRTKDEFLANMSHELRTPLNSILGLSESLLEQRRGSLNEYQLKSLQMIEGSGNHLLELINDILDLSKIEAGKLVYYPQSVSIDELCKSSLAFIEEQAAKKSIEVMYVNQAQVSNIFADARRLKQILVNLLTNAVKFTADKGHVTLTVNTDLDQDLIQFSVMDDGVGIAQKDLQKLFQPFVQVDSSLNRHYEGTGLGLALIQKLTDMHGGSVHVESEVGKGSCFTINLSCNQDTTAALKEPEMPKAIPVSKSLEKVDASETAVCRGRVLLAEDNQPNILTIGEYLESHAYEVVVAHNGLEAIAKAEEINPDIILMDIQMPAMNGLEAIAHLRAEDRFASTPIIALTALAMPGDRERCLQAGATEYLSKPVSLRMLLRTIDKFLASDKSTEN